MNNQFNQFNQFNQPVNMNNPNINMNQAMMNMNQLAGWNFNMNQQAQFNQMINSNPLFIMLWNQMLQNMNNSQFMQNNNMNNFNNNQNMMMQGCAPNLQFQQQNNFNNMNNGPKIPNQINLTFSDTIGSRRVVIQTEPNEYMSSVINKYINKSADYNINLYLFNGKRISQSLTVAEQGLTDGVEIHVSNVGEVRGAIL